jgi:hypothetical protein
MLEHPERVRVLNNRVVAAASAPANPLLAAPEDLQGVSFVGNEYLAVAKSDRIVKIGKNRISVADWRTASNDKVANARPREIAKKAPRTFESYLQSVGLSDMNAFIAEVRQQSKLNWKRELSAATINAYLREGAGMTKTDEILPAVPVPSAADASAAAGSLRGNGRKAALPPTSGGQSRESRRRPGATKKQPK